MKKIYLYAIMGAGFLLGTTSCGEDYLNVNQYDIIQPDIMLTSQSYIEQGLQGLYDEFYPEQSSNNHSDIRQGWNLKPHMAMANYPAMDIQADGWDVNFNRQAWTTLQEEFNGGWTKSYTAIDRANRFLDNLSKADASIFENGETTRKTIEAEARAVRGYFYTWLVQNFGGVPLLKTGDTYVTSPGKKRGTAQEAWEMIIEDYEFARDNLDWNPWKGNYGRITKGAAKAYLAQAYMYQANQGDRATWMGKAKKELKDIIDSGVYSLNPCFGQIHLEGVWWQSESIWEIAFPVWANMSWGAGSQSDAIWWPAQLKGGKEYGGWGPHYISYEFCWSFEPGDKRLDYEVAQYGHTNPFIMAQVPEDDAARNPYGPDFGRIGVQPNWRSSFITSDNVPNNFDMKLWKELSGYKGKEYIAMSSIQHRLAQVYLNYAETCFETEGDDSAEGWLYIQKIRDRAWGALEAAAPQDKTPGTSSYPFPFQLNRDPSVKAPDAKAFYSTYKRSPGKITGKVKKLVGGDVQTPQYVDDVYTSTYDYTPYSAAPWKVALVQERRHELLAEYSLWYDITRMGMAKEYLDAEYPYNTEALNAVSIPGYQLGDKLITNPHTVRAYQHRVSREIYPIPVDELVANPELTQADQNPEY
ncbi:hypothetical protein FACS189414_1160 [Bacteroidia bacterium]|nr:hypothetical protein AGMMS49574_17670 [Bacteroidia bacterium]GHU75982.1 hypothetical protein FACS189414_1160 [Bacteroidia bacterium]